MSTIKKYHEHVCIITYYTLMILKFNSKNAWFKGHPQQIPKPISLWCRGVVVITTAQLHSTKPELRFCAGSNPARDVSEIRDGEDIWQWSRLGGNKAKRLSSVNHATKTIYHLFNFFRNKNPSFVCFVIPHYTSNIQNQFNARLLYVEQMDLEIPFFQT